MILTAVYRMFRTDEAWNPSDLFKVDMSIGLQDKQKQKAIQRALKLLASEGLIKLSLKLPHSTDINFSTLSMGLICIRILG